ncbi:MAG: hypothetical protein EOP04_28115, partial [Proteobacteria bacterium]
MATSAQAVVTLEDGIYYIRPRGVESETPKAQVVDTPVAPVVKRRKLQTVSLPLQYLLPSAFKNIMTGGDGLLTEDPLYPKLEAELKKLTKLELNVKKSKNQIEAIEGLDYIWTDFDNLIDLKLIISDKRHTKKILTNLIENDVWASEKIQNFVIELIECEVTDDMLVKFFKEVIPKMVNIRTLEIELERTTITDKTLHGFVKFCLPKLLRLEQFKLFVDETKVSDDGLIALFSGLSKAQK